MISNHGKAEYMVRFKIEINPMGAIRMTNRGKFVKKNAQRYLDYKTQIGWEAKNQCRLEVPIRGLVMIERILYIMPLPESGKVTYTENGKRKKRTVQPGDYHITKPDADNLFKGVTDALNGILWADDSLICDIGRQKKIYGLVPGIEIEFKEML